MTETTSSASSANPDRAPIRNRVAIVGAGPGGLSAAIAFQKAGFHVRVFERHPRVQGIGGAILLNAIGLNIMRYYGADVGDTFTGHSQTFKSHDGRYTRVVFPEDPELLSMAGATGWTSGMMRSQLYSKLQGVIPEGTIVPNRKFTGFEDRGEDVVLHFADGEDYVADLLVGADGIDSLVRQQMFGYSSSKHLGIAVWLAWTDRAKIDRRMQYIRHSDKHQFGYAPLIYDGKECVEWWFVEPCTENQAMPDDIRSYIGERIKDFESPVGEIFDATDLDDGHLFRWVIKWRDPLKTWSKGRVTLLGDACHAVSPYAGYGAGMALEDGFFLGRNFAGVDLASADDVSRALGGYEEQRVDYTNSVVSGARNIGRMFHNAPWIMRRVRDFMLNHTGIPNKQIGAQYTKESYGLMQALLHSGAFPGRNSDLTRTTKE